MTAADTLALVHTGCGHAAAIGTGKTFETATRRQAEHMRLGPEWEFWEVPREEAAARYAAGPCEVCRITGLSPAGEAR